MKQNVVSHLLIFFAVAYFAQGIGQYSGLINQPLTYYLKDVLHMDASQITNYLAVLTIPWAIKPLYGLLSDCLPLFGYRRKAYLLLMNLVAAFGFLLLAGSTDPQAIIQALLLTAAGTAFSDVLVDAIMVERGQETGLVKRFQGQQWLWFNMAGIGTALVGGALCQYLPPASALHTAALIATLAPLAVIITSWLIVKEKQSPASLDQLKSTGHGLKQALRSPILWVAMAFTVAWKLHPGFGMPLYFHLTNELHFSQAFIGQLNAYHSAGHVLGALIFSHYLADRLSTVNLIKLAVGLSVISTLSYLLLNSPLIAIALYMLTGSIAQIASLAMYSMAAEACPKQAEAFTFAMLMSLANLSGQGSAMIGSHLYVDVFHNQLGPVIVISAICAGACFLFVPLIGKVAVHNRQS